MRSQHKPQRDSHRAASPVPSQGVCHEASAPYLSPSSQDVRRIVRELGIATLRSSSVDDMCHLAGVWPPTRTEAPDRNRNCATPVAWQSVGNTSGGLNGGTEANGLRIQDQSGRMEIRFLWSAALSCRTWSPRALAAWNSLTHATHVFGARRRR